MLRTAGCCAGNARKLCSRFIDGDELARRLETGTAPRLTPRMFMHKIQRACSEQVNTQLLHASWNKSRRCNLGSPVHHCHRPNDSINECLDIFMTM